MKDEKPAEPLLPTVALFVATVVPSPQFSVAVRESPAGAVQVTSALMLTPVCPVAGAANVQLGGGRAVSLIDTENDLLGFGYEIDAFDVAVSDTAPLVGTLLGAVYVTDVVVTLDSAPQAAPAQSVPARVQVTPLLEASNCTAAANCTLCEGTCTDMTDGLTETARGLTVTATGPMSELALSGLVLSARLKVRL